MDKELIDKYAPGANCIEPMKVWKLPDGKEYKFAEIANSGDYFAQLKKDGYWYQFEKTLNGTCYLFSRTISRATGILTEKLDNVPHIAKTLGNNLPNGTTLIGEIYYPGQTSKSVTTIMGCLPEKAIERQKEKGLIHYYIHDIIKYKGESLIEKSAWDRYQTLKKCWKECNLSGYDYLELANIFTENIQEEVMYALDAGEEGMVLKKKDCPYSPGKRPAWHNLKIKKVDYLDAVCMGFCDPTKLYTGKEIENWDYWIRDTDEMRMQGKFFGEEGFTAVTKGYYYKWKTAIEVGAYDENGKLIEIGTVASGLNDELREKFSTNPEDYVDKVVMLQAMEKDNEAHTLRHAFFKGFRDDKDSSECTIKTIFNS